MANTMDVDVAGCILQMEIFPPITMKFYAGAATALNAETTYPWDATGILSTGSYQLASPPMVGMLVKFKDIDTYDAPVVEGLATGGNGNLIAGVITHIPRQTVSTGYLDVAVYLFHPMDILKLYASDHASATVPSWSDGVSFYTGERAFHQDNTNGVGYVIKSPPALGDDFLLLWVGFGLLL